MSTLRDLPVARKFTLAFGLVCLFSIVLGGYTVAIFRNIATLGADVSGHAIPSVLVLGEIRGALNAARRQDLDLLLCTSPDCVAAGL